MILFPQACRDVSKVDDDYFPSESDLDYFAETFTKPVRRGGRLNRQKHVSLSGKLFMFSVKYSESLASTQGRRDSDCYRSTQCSAVHCTAEGRAGGRVCNLMAAH